MISKNKNRHKTRHKIESGIEREKNRLGTMRSPAFHLGLSFSVFVPNRSRKRAVAVIEFYDIIIQFIWPCVRRAYTHVTHGRQQRFRHGKKICAFKFKIKF